MMAMSMARTLWTEQRAATHTIRERYGLEAALDYPVSEKLLTFVDAAGL